MVRFLFLMPLVLVICASSYEYGYFQYRCTSHLKRASIASTVQLAHGELEQAMVYLETHGRTAGNTSLLWPDPANDIDYWYKNLGEAYKELESVTTPVEKSNALLKLRETLVRHDGNVRVPANLWLYPNIYLYWALYLFGLLMLVFTAEPAITIKIKRKKK